METNSAVKQVIIIRKDLNMRKGKIVAQACHASMEAFLHFFNKKNQNDKILYTANIEKNSILDKWLNGIYTKICLYVNSEKELVSIYETIKSNTNIPCCLIEDCGLTEFHEVKTKTCVGIGPYWSDEIDKYTHSLKLL